jgi:hypothetical protein
LAIGHRAWALIPMVVVLAVAVGWLMTRPVGVVLIGVVLIGVTVLLCRPGAGLEACGLSSAKARVAVPGA